MQPEQGDPARLWDMLESARAVEQFIAGKTFNDYLANRLLRRAVEREIEIIGEAARKVSPLFRTAHPEIPWLPIIAQRHVLSHEYGEIKHERIWRVASFHVGELIRLLEPLVSPPPPPPVSPA